MLNSFNHGKHMQISSITLNKWWSFFLLVSFLIVLNLYSGCSSSREAVCLVPQDPANIVVPDAITLVEFQKLSAGEKADRRVRADVFLKQVKNAKRSDVLVTGLANAAGLAPDNQDTWLKLAHVWRWVGDYDKVQSCLGNAMAALDYLHDGKGYSREKISKIKKSVSLDQALLRAWLHYDRGEWDKGLRWANRAYDIEHGSTACRQIKGLLEACAGERLIALELIDDIKRVNVHSTDAMWILAALDRSRQKWGAAISMLGGVKPTGDHISECYRDMASLAEYLGQWGDARRWYDDAGAYLPIDDKTCLTKRSYYRLDMETERVLMPVWLAFNRYYVTGSRSAYTSLALEKFDKAVDPTVKDFWGGQTVNSAGILIRWDIDKGYAYRARGLVFMGKGQTRRGMNDLRKAAGILAAKGRQDSRIEGIFGHAMLLEARPQRALRHLRASVELDAASPTVWSDLGMALVQLGENEEAERAFTMAVGLDPNLATGWYNRGLIYIHRKEWDLAEQDLMKAAALAPDNEKVGALLQQLKQRN